MAYLVNAQAGDTLCSIARANGYSNCGTLRSDPGNAAYLDAPLQVGDPVTIPGFRDSWVYSKIATGRRWTVRWKWPSAAPQAATVRLVRKTAAAPAAPAVLQTIGISRFGTNAATPVGFNDWCNHTQFDFDAASRNDPCTFSIEIRDPGATGATAAVYLEALQPLYNANGTLASHQRFAAGPIRSERSLDVTLQHLAALPAGHFWSPELRLVTWSHDKLLRAEQTLLVTDLHDSQGAAIEILDQHVRVVYEDASCPNAARARCIKDWHEIALPRGDSVTLDGYIVRRVADGSALDNGQIPQAAFRDRVAVNCRRIYAQDELSFTVGTLATIDPPNDMLTVAEESGANAAGTCTALAGQQGEVGFTLTFTSYQGAAVVHAVGPIPIPAGNTPMQTAQLLAQALTLLPNIVAVTSQCAAQTGMPQGCVDVCISTVGGTASISHLTPDDRQDSAQCVTNVHFNIDNLDDDQGASILQKGGQPMRRQLFKSQPVTAGNITIFVAKEQRGGLTTMALHPLAAALQTDAEVRNCISMNVDNMSADMTERPLTLPHEIGHALTDADHVPFHIDNKSLMFPGQTMLFDGYGTYRISGPGYAPHLYQLVGDDQLRQARQAAWADPAVNPLPGELELMEYATTMHELIRLNGSIVFNPR